MCTGEENVRQSRGQKVNSLFSRDLSISEMLGKYRNYRLCDNFGINGLMKTINKSDSKIAFDQKNIKWL